MSIAPETEIPARHPEHDPHPVDLSRRRLGVGLGVSAVFTLASRPVLAGQCMAASSHASGNTSTHGPALTCTGLSPKDWVALADSTDPNNPNNGYPPGSNGNVPFHDVFASGGRASLGNGTRLYVAMGGTVQADSASQSTQGGFLGSHGNDNSSDPINTIAIPSGTNLISAEFAATLLNIRSDRVPANVLDETKLIGMWNEWMTTGGYAPMAGAMWNEQQIVTYLQSLQGA